MTLLENKLIDVREEYLQRMTRGNGHLLKHVEQYANSRRGKMLRPRMTLLAAKTLGEEVYESRHIIQLAVCVEMLHNASLLHDDVIDHDEQRRGQKSVNALWGNEVAVLVGDYHLAQIMALLSECGDDDATKLMIRTVMAMVEGELIGQEVLAGREMTEDTYLRIIDGKTAQLFATACALGNPEYHDFGLHYGRLFQLYDDISDHEDNKYTARFIEQEEAIMKGLKKLDDIEMPYHIQ